MSRATGWALALLSSRGSVNGEMPEMNFLTLRAAKRPSPSWSMMCSRWPPAINHVFDATDAGMCHQFA
jgi:hypothetical protein